jgi:hypothetical protein
MMPSEALPKPATAAPVISGDAVQVADAAVSSWRSVEAALSPIIGKRGVAALYQRSLFLARAAHPCLASVHEGALQPGEFAALHAVLVQEPATNAAAASRALLETFRGLLANLIGEALTERLLKSVRDNPSNGSAVQDTSP